MRKFLFALLGLGGCVTQVIATDSHGTLPATAANVRYGPYQRNVLDFWKAPGDGPHPLLVHIHGGGWTGGSKKRTAADVKPFLDQGISYAAIQYRFSTQAPLPAPVHDAARAIQFIRSKAKDWSVNTSRIGLTGASAGACTSMWILLHDDLADPESVDPVLRESTRVAAAAVRAGQTSIDPKVIERWLGPNVLQHRMIPLGVGEKTIADALKNYAQHRATYVEFSPYNHLDGTDPPLFMSYDNNMTLPSENPGHGIHHPVFGIRLKEKADQAGHECHLLIPGISQPEEYATPVDFLSAKLLAP
jgi:acetyl esterase/lipase